MRSGEADLAIRRAKKIGAVALAILLLLAGAGVLTLARVHGNVVVLARHETDEEDSSAQRRRAVRSVEAAREADGRGAGHRARLEPGETRPFGYYLVDHFSGLSPFPPGAVVKED